MKRLCLRVRLCCTVLLGASLLAPVGCSSTTQGSSQGRIDPYASTSADERSVEVSTVSMLEFADQVSQALAARIPDIPEIADSPHRVALEMGNIENDTRTPVNEFVSIRRRIFLTLANNRQVTDLAVVNEHPRRADDDAREFRREESPDLLDEDLSSDGAATDRYRPEDTFIVQGTFAELVRGRQGTYLFDVTIMNAKSRNIVFAEQFTSKEVR